MNFQSFRRLLPRAVVLAFCATALISTSAFAQQQQRQAPLSNSEFLALVRQLPQHPNLKQQLVEEIRSRGISFPLTSGLRAFVATKSGDDEELRRVLEEAERRFLNPKDAPTLPDAAEAADLLAKTREATLEAVDQMPDFVVKQLVTRSYALARSQNWHVDDRLVVGVTYRVKEGEKYRLLAVNGVAGASASEEKSDYKEAGGANSTGEFVSILKGLFDDDSQTEFKAIDTDTLRGRRTIVYEYNIKKANSKWLLDHGDSSVIAAHHGKVWIDREKMRVLRVESNSYDVPQTFAITDANVAVDYDWVTIPSQGDYLLPSHSVVIMTIAERGQVAQYRNEIRFRNYQKFGTELKILDDDIIDDDAAPPPPNQQPKQPENGTVKPPEKKP